MKLPAQITPPASIEIEQAVLGAAMISQPAFEEMMTVIKTERAFHDATNQLIFRAMQEIYAESRPCDLMIVTETLKKHNYHDFSYIVELTQRVSSSAHLDVHARILLQYMLRRDIIMSSIQAISMATNSEVDVFETLAKWQSNFDALNDAVFSNQNNKTFAESLDELVEHVEFLSSREPDEITGIHTGFNRINQFTNGYQPGHLIILAARPGMGKTAKVLKTALANVKIGKAVGMVSLEMPVLELTARIVSLDSNFHLGQLLKKGFEKDAYFLTLQDKTHKMKDYPLMIDDSSKSDIVDVIARARMWKREHDIQLLIVDYLQLMSDKTKKNNREQEISTISRRMKLLAKELQIPVIVLSQLSRKVEERTDKRPRLSDLRESGAIEQDADVIEFIYRPDYYGYEVDDVEMLNEGTDTEIIFGKNRHGSVGMTSLKWIGDKTKFVDPTDVNERRYFEGVNDLPY